MLFLFFAAELPTLLLVAPLTLEVTWVCAGSFLRTARQPMPPYPAGASTESQRGTWVVWDEATLGNRWVQHTSDNSV